MIFLLLLLLAASAPSICHLTRDEKGKIQRSKDSVHSFRKDHPCPATGKTSGACPGWVVDHLLPLCAGGRDAPENMMWQEFKASKEKDKVEVALCQWIDRECGGKR